MANTLPTPDDTAALRTRIATLEQTLRETQAQLVYRYAQAERDIDKLDVGVMLGSTVILRLEHLGGRDAIPPVALIDGLHSDTIKALKAEFGRSFQRATASKPRPAPDAGIST